MSKLLSFTIYSVYGLILIGIGLLFFAPTIPGVGAVEVKIVKSGSMEPSIMTGGIVVVNEVSTYKEGDVITFSGSDSSIPTTHRIIGTEMVNGETFFVTKGDANEERDSELVASGNILGKVVFSMPFAGFVLDFARQPLGFILLVGVPALLIIIDEIVNIWREVGRMRRSKMGITAISPLVIAPYRPSEPVVGKVVKDTIGVSDVRYAKYTAEQKQTRRELVRFMDIKPVVKEVKAKAGVAKLAVATPPPARTHFDIRPKLTAAMILVALVGVGTNLFNVGGTLSFAEDQESAVANAFEAQNLDFLLSPATSTITFVEGEPKDLTGIEVLVTPEPGVVNPLVYSVEVEYVSGNATLCDAVNLSATGALPYGDELMSLTGSDLDFLLPWQLDFSLAGGFESGLGDTCVVDVVIKGWSDPYDVTLGGYEDMEKLRLTLVAESEAVPTITAGAFTTSLLEESTVVEGGEEDEEVTSGDDVEESENQDEGEGETLEEEKEVKTQETEVLLEVVNDEENKEDEEETGDVANQEEEAEVPVEEEVTKTKEEDVEEVGDGEEEVEVVEEVVETGEEEME